MVERKAGKMLFAVLVAAMFVSVGALSYYYLGEGQEAYSGDGDYVPEDEQAVTVDYAPDFNYQTVTGGSVSLSGLRGSVVVLDFMATWCGPCESQILNLADIQDEYAGQGVVFISIDVDTGETASELLAFRNDLGATWQFALDADGVGMSPEYSATSIPTMVFINRDGSIARRDVGVMDADTLRAAIDPLL